MSDFLGSSSPWASVALLLLAGVATLVISGLAIALGGIIRDAVAALLAQGGSGAAMGYDCVYGIEIVLLFATLITMLPLIRRDAAYA